MLASLAQYFLKEKGKKESLLVQAIKFRIVKVFLKNTTRRRRVENF